MPNKPLSPPSVGVDIWTPADLPNFITYKGNICAAAYDIIGTNPENSLILNAVQRIVDNSPAGCYHGSSFQTVEHG